LSPWHLMILRRGACCGEASRSHSPAL